MQIPAFCIPKCSQKTAILLDHALGSEALDLVIQATQALYQHSWGPGRKRYLSILYLSLPQQVTLILPIQKHCFCSPESVRA